MTPEQFEEIFEKVKSEPELVERLKSLIISLAVSGEILPSLNSASFETLKVKDVIHRHVGGGTPSKSNSTYWGGNIRWASVKDVNKGKFLDTTKDSITESGLENSSSNLIPENRLIVVTRMGLGKVNINRVPIAINQDLRAFEFNDRVALEFGYLFFKSLLLEGTGTTVKGVKIKDILELDITVPTLEEQKRIVAKVDELMALCDELENAGHKRNVAKTNFNSSSNSHLCGGRAIQAETLKRSFELQVGNIEDLEKIRKTVFTLAIQGKLTTQSSSDEPALELLNRIDVEKAKDESSASRARKTDGNDYGFLKYEIPSNWAWTSLAQIGHISPKTEGDEAQQASFVEMASIFAEYGKSHLTETRIWAKIKKGYTRFREGDVGLAKITPCFENGKSAVFDSLVNGIGAGTTELLVVRPYLVETRYILTFLKSEFFIGNGIPLMTGTAGQKRVPSGYFANCPFPLPPLEEQKRIVVKVDELMTLCDELESRLENEQAIKIDLLKTLVA